MGKMEYSVILLACFILVCFFFLALAKNSCHNIKEIWTVFSNEIDNEQK